MDDENVILARKRIELITQTLEHTGNSEDFFRYVSNNRSSFYHLFYDGTNLKSEVIKLMPIEFLKIASRVLRVVSTLSSYSSDGTCSGNGVSSNWQFLIKGLSEMNEILKQSIVVSQNTTPPNKDNLIFISHSTNDKKYAKALIDILERIGMNEKNIFCSSIPPYNIKNGDIYDTLRNFYQTRSLYIIYLLSKNYYNSVASLNEMGAGWVLKTSYKTFVLPGFSFNKIEGVIDKNKVGIDLNFDGGISIFKSTFRDLRDDFIKIFNLPTINEDKWDRYVSDYIEAIKKAQTEG